jgi:hypothetical protein
MQAFSDTHNIINLLDELGKRLLKQEVHPTVAGTVNWLITSALRIHSLRFARLAELEKDLAIIKQEREILRHEMDGLLQVLRLDPFERRKRA